MRRILVSIFIFSCFSSSVFAIDLIINGKRFYIKEYQISEDGMEIKINHQIDMPTECSKSRKTTRVRRVPSSNSQAHRNPNRRISIIERFMNDLNTDRNKRKKRHQ